MEPRLSIALRFGLYTWRKIFFSSRSSDQDAFLALVIDCFCFGASGTVLVTALLLSHESGLLAFLFFQLG